MLSKIQIISERRRRKNVVVKVSDKLDYSVWISFEAVIIEKTIKEK